jgi:hypothetical protein
VISYSEEVHQPTKIDATKNAKKRLPESRQPRGEPPSFKVGFSLVTKLGIALGLALALWMAFKKGWAGRLIGAVRGALGV